MKLLTAIFLLFSLNAYAQDNYNILINTDILDHLNISYESNESDLAMVNVNEDTLDNIAHHSHDFNRCGGFELIEQSETQALNELVTQKYMSEIELMFLNFDSEPITFKEEIFLAIETLNSDNLKETVDALSQYKTRSSRQKKPNEHVYMMKEKVDAIIEESELLISSSLIDHSRTKQKTLKVRIEGSDRPDEVVILGGHLDSTAFFSAAPGADDNASGSANLMEVLRVLSLREQPKRTIEFFWYAAEEIGLIGSGEIAKSYKADQVDVIAVMQLDMTGFSGSGEFNIGNITDFTSPWLQQILHTLNNHYINAVVHEDKCGYGCSDHASWFRQGFDTVFPIEAKFRESNKKIHSSRDTMDLLNFKHSLTFSKLALSFAMELANSELRKPEFQ